MCVYNIYIYIYSIENMFIFSLFPRENCQLGSKTMESLLYAVNNGFSLFTFFMLLSIIGNTYIPIRPIFAVFSFNVP